MIFPAHIEAKGLIQTRNALQKQALLYDVVVSINPAAISGATRPPRGVEKFIRVRYQASFYLKIFESIIDMIDFDSNLLYSIP